MRLSKTMLHPYSKNRFIDHAHSNHAFRYGRMTPCPHNHQRLALFDSMGDQVVMTHAKQINEEPKNEELLCLAEQRPSYFLPFRCAYLSHIHFHFTSTRAPPASRDSWSPMHVGVALPKQMRPLTYTGLLPSAVMHPRSTAGVGGGTTPGFSQILNSGPSIIHWSCPSFRFVSISVTG